MNPSGRLVAGFVVGWWAAFVTLLIYWIGAEAAEIGRQYAEPFLPCAFVALVTGAPLGALVAAITRRG